MTKDELIATIRRHKEMNVLAPESVKCALVVEILLKYVDECDVESAVYDFIYLK